MFAFERETLPFPVQSSHLIVRSPFDVRRLKFARANFKFNVLIRAFTALKYSIFLFCCEINAAGFEGRAKA